MIDFHPIVYHTLLPLSPGPDCSNCENFSTLKLELRGLLQMYDMLIVLEIVLYDSVLNIQHWISIAGYNLSLTNDNQSNKIIQGQLICGNDQHTCG